MGKKKEKEGFVDILRIIAIILILYFHINFEFTRDNSLRQMGFIGISLFFIISGYVLAKNYSINIDFSLKWFLKRLVTIIPLYYLSLIMISALFSNQVYSGSILKNLVMHFLFIDFLSPETAYGIISPAWFLTPLVFLYLFFPLINKSISKYNWTYLIFFAITFLNRIVEPNNTSFYPTFFLVEFAFGMLFFYNKKSPYLLTSIAILLISPSMIIPFIIFYIASLIKTNKITNSELTSTGVYFLFLFHEAFIKTITGSWKIFSQNILSSLIILIVSSTICLLVSDKIKHYLKSKL